MTDEEMDAIYDWVDGRFYTGAFNEVDERLLGISLTDEDALFTWLTVTLPAKSKLKNRSRLYKALLKLMNEEVLRGLE